MKKKLSVFLAIFAIVAAGIVATFLLTDSRHNVPEGALKKLGTVTRISPNCGRVTYLQDGKVHEEDGPVLCDGGGFITVDDFIIQYETGLSPDGFSYDIGSVTVGNEVTAIYVLNENGAQINCEGCGIFLSN